MIILFLQKEIPKPNASCEEKWEKYVDDLYFLQLFDKVVWNCIFSTVWQNLLSCTLMIIPTYFWLFVTKFSLYLFKKKIK